MLTATPEPISTPLPSIFDHFPRPATQPNRAAGRRKIALWTVYGLVPAAAGAVAALRGRRMGVVGGGIAALALGALRWQLARWFTDTPDYLIEARHGELEVRRYPLYVEACATVTDAHDLETALDRGFSRLACYLYGANAEREHVAMTTPCMVEHRGGSYAMTIAMPPGRDVSSLPLPDDARVSLCEVMERRVAVLPFRGRFTRENLESHERDLVRRLVDAGLATRGSVVFAGYDSPTVLPLLRRNEVWIDLV